jgi:hypothetical protein
LQPDLGTAVAQFLGSVWVLFRVEKIIQAAGQQQPDDRYTDGFEIHAALKTRIK